MPGSIKNVDDYKYALVFDSVQSGQTEVELFRTPESREARKNNLDEAKIRANYAHVNVTT